MDSGIAFFLSVALNAFAARTWKDVPPFVTFLAISVIVFIGLFSWCLWFSNDNFLDAAASLLVYVASVEFYVLLILFVVNSVSVSILMNIYVRPLSPGDLAGLYSDEKILALRLERLCSMGLIEGEGTSLVITTRGYCLLRTLDGAKNFFGHRPTLSGHGRNEI